MRSDSAGPRRCWSAPSSPRPTPRRCSSCCTPRGLRLRPRVSATLEVESGINDPFAIFITIVLIEIILHGSKPWHEIAAFLVAEALVGALIGYVGGRGDGACAQPAEPAAGPARAVRRDGCGGHLRPGRGRCTARAFSRSISPDSSSATARSAPTMRSSPSSTPPPGSRRSACSCCSGCWHGRTGCR